MILWNGETASDPIKPFYLSVQISRFATHEIGNYSLGTQRQLILWNG